MAFFWCAFFHWIQLGCEVMMAFSIFRNVAVSFVSCRIRRILVHLFFAFNHIYLALCLGSLNSTSSELETCLGVILVLSGTARGSVLTFETKNPLTWDPTAVSISYEMKPVWVRKLFAGKLIVTCSDVLWSYREYIWVRCSCFSHCNWHTIELTPIACYIDVFRPVGTPYRHDEGVHAIHVVPKVSPKKAAKKRKTTKKKGKQ